MRRSKRYMAGIMAGVVMAGHVTCYAIGGVGDVVVDPTNLIQNTLTATNSLRQVAQQAQMISNQIQQIAHAYTQVRQGVTNLTAIPLQLSNEISQLMDEYNRLLQEAQGITYQYNAVRGQFERLYDAARNGNGMNMLGYTNQLISQLRQAAGTAMQSQGVVTRLRSEQSALRRALAASESAQGNLAVQQAGNQVAGVIAEQQAQLIELIAASERTQTSFLAAQAALDEASRANAQRTMQGWGTCTDCADAGVRELPKLH